MLTTGLTGLSSWTSSIESVVIIFGKSDIKGRGGIRSVGMRCLKPTEVSLRRTRFSSSIDAQVDNSWATVMLLLKSRLERWWTLSISDISGLTRPCNILETPEHYEEVLPWLRGEFDELVQVLKPGLTGHVFILEGRINFLQCVDWRIQ